MLPALWDKLIPERRVASVAAFPKTLGTPLRTETGVSLAVSIDDPDASCGLMEAVVHGAAGCSAPPRPRSR